MQGCERWSSHSVGNSREFANITTTELGLLSLRKKQGKIDVRKLHAADVRAFFRKFYDKVGIQINTSASTGILRG